MLSLTLEKDLKPKRALQTVQDLLNKLKASSQVASNNLSSSKELSSKAILALMKLLELAHKRGTSVKEAFNAGKGGMEEAGQVA